MEIIKAANKVIKDGIALLPDDAKVDFKARSADIFINEAIANAMGATNKNEEKEAMLEAYSVQEAGRVVSTLWRLQLLTDDLEAEYRKLPPLKEESDKYNAYITNRRERLEDAMNPVRAIQDEEKDLEIFMGIINGISAKDAEKRYEEYQEQVKAASQRG